MLIEELQALYLRYVSASLDPGIPFQDVAAAYKSVVDWLDVHMPSGQTSVVALPDDVGAMIHFDRGQREFRVIDVELAKCQRSQMAC